MISLAIGLSVLLVVVILVLLFRIQILASIFKGSYEKKVGQSNKINAILMLAFFIIGGLAFIWSWMDSSEFFYLPVASEHGEMIDSMFWLTMIILGIVFAITQALLFIYSYVYQHKEDKRAYYFPHNNKLEIIWTIIPAVVMALLVFRGWKTWTNITNPAPKESVIVEVLGKQFNWLVRYPGADNELGRVSHTLIDGSNEFGFDFTDERSKDDFVPMEIHVPKDHPVLFNIRSRDVIHSVYAPFFRLQMHAVPGMPTKFWFTPTKTTAEMASETNNPDFKYEIACNQICGRGHFAMRIVIVVDEPDEYQAWVAKQKSFVEMNPDVLANMKMAIPVAAPDAVTPQEEKAKTAEEIVREKATL